MLHHIIIKYNNSVKDKDAFAKEAEILFSGLVGTVPGINDVSVHKNCIDRSNRYDLMIVIDMEKDALDDYDDSMIHKRWKKDYSDLIEMKAIFDCEK